MLPPRPKMTFGQRHVAINIYNICKGHLGSRGGSKNKLKDTSFIFPMTNVTILGVFRTHAQKEYGKVLEMKSTYIINILALFFLNSQYNYSKSGLNGTSTNVFCCLLCIFYCHTTPILKKTSWQFENFGVCNHVN